MTTEGTFELASDLATVLDIERLDRDLFRGFNADDSRPWPVLYGGQVAAQALRAAGLTVPEGRFPHSLHGYFLRRGRNDRPVLLQVRRDRDGRSFSARNVAAIQDGEVIFSMVASFQIDEASVEFDDEPRPPRPEPEELTARPFGMLVEVREIAETSMDGERMKFSDHMWVKAAHPLPGDRLVHACALTYVSDMGSGFGQTEQTGLARGGPSLDHSLWFQRPVKLDDWVELHMHPLKAGGGRGLYRGTIRDRDGHLAAMLNQEILLRWPNAATVS